MRASRRGQTLQRELFVYARVVHFWKDDFAGECRCDVDKIELDCNENSGYNAVGDVTPKQVV